MWRAKNGSKFPYRMDHRTADEGRYPPKWWILQRGDSVTGVLLAEDGSRLRTETDGFILVDEQ